MNTVEDLFERIKTGNTTQLEALLVANPELVNAKDARGFTPLIFATYFDNLDENNIDILENSGALNPSS